MDNTGYSIDSPTSRLVKRRYRRRSSKYWNENVNHILGKPQSETNTTLHSRLKENNKNENTYTYKNESDYENYE